VPWHRPQPPDHRAKHIPAALRLRRHCRPQCPKSTCLWPLL